MPSGDLARKFGPPNSGITMTTIQSSARGYDANGSGNGSDDVLNQLPQIEDPKQQYLVQKTFEVTATESSRAENS